MVPLPAEVKNFLLLQIYYLALVIIQPPIQRVQGAISLVGDEHAPRTTVEVQNKWRYNSSLSHVLQSYTGRILTLTFTTGNIYVTFDTELMWYCIETGLQKLCGLGTWCPPMLFLTGKHTWKQGDICKQYLQNKYLLFVKFELKLGRPIGNICSIHTCEVP